MTWKIFQHNEHLKITMYANSLVGMWPNAFQDSPILQKLYLFYGICAFIYCSLYTLSGVLQLVILFTDEVIYLDGIIANLGITILYTTVLLRAYQIKTGRVAETIQEIIEKEQKVYRSMNKDVIKIYERYATRNKLVNKIYLASVFTTAMLYFIHPLFVEDTFVYYPTKNVTVIKKATPLSAWKPIEVNTHYVQVYLWNILDGCVGASFVTYTDIFMFSLIIFPLGQMKILGHVFKNFQNYALDVQKQLDCDMEHACFITLREAVIEHKNIIRYVYDLNQAMRGVMVFDVLQSSIQLASIILQVLLTTMNVNNFLYVGQSSVSMVTRLFYYYWYANEISVQSSGIADALWESKWYEHSNKIKRMIIIIIMRCNRPIGLEIGPFSQMSLNTFLGILKATYSYMMVVYR